MNKGMVQKRIATMKMQHALHKLSSAASRPILHVRRAVLNVLAQGPEVSKKECVHQPLLAGWTSVFQNFD